MKKALKIIVAVFACACMALSITACNKEHVHNFSEWVTTLYPTCISEGLKARVCPECLHTETEVLEKLPHNYERAPELDTKGTCKADGKEVSMCSFCLDKKEVAVPGDHKISSKYYPTYTGLGHYSTWGHHRSCEYCGKTMEVEDHEKKYGYCSKCQEYIFTPTLTFSDSGTTITGITDRTVTEISVPDSLRSGTNSSYMVSNIAYQAFKNCTKLETVYMTKYAPALGRAVFIGCSKLTTIYYDCAEDDWDYYTSDWNTNWYEGLTKITIVCTDKTFTLNFT